MLGPQEAAWGGRLALGNGDVAPADSGGAFQRCSASQGVDLNIELERSSVHMEIGRGGWKPSVTN